jgi:hypothetical protein
MAVTNNLAFTMDVEEAPTVSSEGLAFDMPNETIHDLETQETLAQRRDINLPELEGEDTPPRNKGFFEEVGEDVARTLSPFAYPMLEVMNTINTNVGGAMYDVAVRAPYLFGSTGYENIKNMVEAVDPEVDFEWEGGQNLTIPEVLKNQSYVSDPEMAEYYDKVGLYTSLGVGTNAFAARHLANLGKGVFKFNKKGARLNPVTGKPMTGVEGTKAGITRDLANQPLRGEVDLAVRMATGGFVASDLTGSDSLFISIPAEIAAGMLRRSPTYFDFTTGVTRNADTGTEILNKKTLSLFEKKYGVEDLRRASGRIRESATDPYEAHLALEAAETATKKGGVKNHLSVAQNMNDAGLFVNERALAVEDAVFAGNINDQLDQAQYSLSQELSKLLNPETGTYNWEAIENLLPRISEDLLSGVNDRVRIARENLESLLPLYNGDVTKMSKEFNKEFQKVFDDIGRQEDALWKPINDSGFQLDVVPFKRAIFDIVQNSNRETNLPAEKFAEFLGMGLMRTDKGWVTVALSKRGTKQMKGKDVVFPKVPMGNVQSPQVMKTVRTGLNEMVRDPNISVDKDSAVKAQQAAVDILTNNIDNVPKQFRDSYLTATSYSKHINDTFNRGTVMPKVVKAVPEKKLETAVGGATKSETDVNVVAREFEEVFNLATPTSNAAQSSMLKSAEGMFLAKFAQQVDPNDLATFDAFIAQHRTWFKRFPDAGNMIKDARKKAVKAGNTLKNAELKAEAAKLDIFAGLTGKTPTEIADVILKSSNPLTNARRLKAKLSQDPRALESFQDFLSRRIVGQALDSVAAQVKGAGKSDVVQVAKLSQSLKELDPFMQVFKSKGEREGLDLLISQFKSLEKALSAKGAKGEDYKVSASMAIAAKLGGLKAVSMLFGSQSIVLAGATSKTAEAILKNLTYGNASKIMTEAYKNPELMKILLSNNISKGQLNKLNSDQFQTGRSLYRALVGETLAEEQQQ